jgi:4-hydroxy-2-oxoheptanedioate aldolase
MQTPVNPFKQALREQRAQIGLWLGLGGSTATEICAGAGFDWLLIDGEHAPLGVADVQAQAQVIAGYPATHAIARVPVADPVLIKQYLDTGVQTLLVPMVNSAEQAALCVSACRYPQDDGLGGMRGMAGARASRWGRIADYATAANEQVCLLVQVETREALANLDAIANTPGVDGVFIGPADLSASMGHVGNPDHPVVQAAIDNAIVRTRQAGKALGILCTDEAQARRYLELGALFVAVGLDTQILARQTSALAQRVKTGLPTASGPPEGSVY